MERVLDGAWDERAYWSRANAGEAMPGVLTPLTWDFWGPAAERASRRAFVAMGALERAGADLPADPRERIIAVFKGRVAAKVTFVGVMGDRLPGTTGAAVAEQVLGTLPPDFESHSTLRRVPIIAAKLPAAAVLTPRRLRRLHRDTGAWWSRQVRRSGLSPAEARAQWVEACAWFDRAMTLQVLAVFAVVQPIYDALARLAARAGDPGLAGRLVAGQGSHSEMRVVEDIWRLSRAELELGAFQEEHGFHGPGEGELSSRVWREDAAPVLAMADRYRAKADAESPVETSRLRAEEARQSEAELMSRLPPGLRVTARAVLALGRRNAPLRGIGKTAFLQTIDVARMASRRIGVLLADAGALATPDDVFYLTSGELSAPAPRGGFGDVVEARRVERESYLGLELPSSWKGRPPEATPAGGRHATLTGTAASPGVVEGPARVVLDPDFGEVEPGEILVAPTTDPSWAPVMFTSAALVVDIGGALSHAAIVAREMGIPCVMGTGDGTRRVRTGDVCRVDGNRGTVELLEEAEKR